MADSPAGSYPHEPENEMRGLIGWFATNHVAANLLMFLIIGGGIWGLIVVKKESFPEFNFGQLTVSVPYLGAAPQEVEEGVVVKIEEAIESIQGIRRVDSIAFEGMGQVMIEVEESHDVAEVTDEVKLAVDGISTFPAETERPVISKYTHRRGVLNLQIHGDLDETSLKQLTERIREEVTALPEVSYAEVMGSRPFEISIEISEHTLRQYGLTLDQVARPQQRRQQDLARPAKRNDARDKQQRAKK
ncbi:MAG: efflux RND transporter permease subunit, partial [Gammaproteobacteria bacterium]|nr:efflux RND transporter permease subunit [Gammaproteobacteria bacterium]